VIKLAFLACDLTNGEMAEGRWLIVEGRSPPIILQPLAITLRPSAFMGLFFAAWIPA
jgi:hypothetical protein